MTNNHTQILLAAFILGGLFFIVPELTSAATIKVEMTDAGFEPSKIEINQGDAVEFKNSDDTLRWPASNLHPTHEIYPEFDPLQPIDSGKTWSFRFGKAGTWKYHDHLVPQHSGTVVVKGDADTNNNNNDDNNNQNRVADINDRENKSGFWSRVWNWLKGLWPWGDKTDKNDVNNDKDNKSSQKIDLSRYDKDVGRGDEKMFNDDDWLGSHLKKFGVKDTITELRLLETKFGSCHQPAHRAGHIGYVMFGDEAFVEYSAECQSGYYHGVLEAYFQEHGAENIATTLETLCRGGLNSFFEHQCIHGIGHGLHAWANYELPESLEACDLLPKRQDSCWTGVFMENLAAQLAKPSNSGEEAQTVGNTDVHYTKYLKDDDPLYPCNWVAEKYKGSCYFLQTSRMLQIFGQDFKKISEACASAPVMYQNSCFGSMGRDVGGNFPKNAPREIQECGYVADPNMRIECLNGAVQNGFWDPSGQDFAIGFCKLLTDATEKSSCYTTIISRAPEIMFDAPSKQNFCAKVEPAFQMQCKTTAGI